MAALKKTIIFFLVLRLIAIPGYFLLTELFAPLDFLARIWQENFLLWSWANFDGEHYLSIAQFGYGWRGGFPQYAFFPLLPFFTKIVSFLVQDIFIAGNIVIFLSVYAIISLFPRWLKLIGHRDKLPMLALFLAPGAVFLGSIYSEPVFIALTLGVFVLAEEEKFLPAALLAGLVTASRISGAITALFLIYKLVQSNIPAIRKLALSITSFFGLISYTLFLAITTGDPLNWYHAQGAWGKATATSPFTTIMSYARALTTELTWDHVHLIVFFEVLITLWAVYLLIYVIRQKLLPNAYLFYLSVSLALPIITGSLGSMPRFFLALFPSYVAYSSFSPRLRRVSLAISTVIMIMGVIFFTRGHWLA